METSDENGRRFFAYDERGRQNTLAVCVNPSNPSEEIDFFGSDRTTKTLRDVLCDQVAGTFQFTDANSATGGSSIFYRVRNP